MDNPQGVRIHLDPVADGAPTYVYRLYAGDGELLYVGITNNIGHRFHQHAKREWWYAVAEATLDVYKTRDGARLAEAKAIRDESPRYNRVNGWSGITEKVRGEPLKSLWPLGDGWYWGEWPSRDEQLPTVRPLHRLSRNDLTPPRRSLCQ